MEFAQYPEIGILSIIIKNPEHINKCISVIKPYMFSSLPNKYLYETICNLYESGIFPDYNTLITSLYVNNKINECGGESYIKYLINQEFEQNNIDELCKQLLNSYKYRELLSFITSINNNVDISNIDKVLLSIREFIDNLSNKGSLDSVISFSDASKETWDILVEKLKSGFKIRVTTGFKSLDDVTLGYESGGLWVIAGRPGMGKSAFMCNSVLSGVPSLIFSREMSREQLIQRIVSIKSGVPIFNIRLAALNQGQLNKIQESFKELKTLPVYLDTNFVSSLDYIVSTIKKYVTNYGVKVVHIDYLQLLAERNDSSVHELGRITRMMKLLSGSLGICIVLYSQLNRGLESRQDKRPILSDIRQSGNIEEDADVVMFLYRDYKYNPDTKYKDNLEFILSKQRNGPTGVLLAKFDESTNKIYEE